MSCAIRAVCTYRVYIAFIVQVMCGMNKMGLVDAVSEKIGGTKKTAEDAVDCIFDCIQKTLAQGEEVAVSGFGSFFVKKRSARMGVNPRTGQKIEIAATVTPKFRAGKSLKAAVK